MNKNDRLHKEMLEDIERDDKILSHLITYGDATGDAPSRHDGIPSHVASPTDKQYEKGFFHRAFVSRYDSKFATEVTEKFSNNGAKTLPKGLYKTVRIKWYLNNNKLPKNLIGMKTSITAPNVNEYLVMNNSKEMPQLIQTVKDFEQFVR